MPVERWTDEMLDEIAETLKEASRISQENTEAIRQLREESKENNEAIRQLREESKETYEAVRQQREESKELSIRFNAYQQASQWVVNLAFGLLATATVTTIVTAVLRK